MAKTNLQKAGFPNVDVRLGDGNKLADDLGTFDVILLSGSVASVPRALLERLNPKGRLAAIVGDEPTMQAHFVTHTGNKQFTTQKPWDMCAPRLVNFAETLAFSF
jgi:protein-L-isoaspartate(D-aspartate) O-methyltransferase